MSKAPEPKEREPKARQPEVTSTDAEDRTGRPTTEPLVRVRGVGKTFGGRSGSPEVVALSDIDLDVNQGETLSVVGESGSGKSTLARIILGLLPPSTGRVTFDDIDVHNGERRQLARLRRDMQIVFQDPYSSMNPRMRVRDIVAEPLVTHDRQMRNRAAATNRVGDLLDSVGISPDLMGRYPHEFSGGQRQRIAIARALALEPRLLVLDEPTSALDVSVQAQVLELLATLQRDNHLTYVFVSHNLAVVSEISDRVAVMKTGRIVELGECDQVLHESRHDYTKALVAAVPEPEPARA